MEFGLLHIIVSKRLRILLPARKKDGAHSRRIYVDVCEYATFKQMHSHPAFQALQLSLQRILAAVGTAAQYNLF